MNNDILSAAKYIDTAAADGRLYHFNGVYAWVRMNNADNAMVVIELRGAENAARSEVVLDASEYIEANKHAAGYYRDSMAKTPLTEFFSGTAAA